MIARKAEFQSLCFLADGKQPSKILVKTTDIQDARGDAVLKVVITGDKGVVEVLVRSKDLAELAVIFGNLS